MSIDVIDDGAQRLLLRLLLDRGRIAREEVRVFRHRLEIRKAQHVGEEGAYSIRYARGAQQPIDLPREPCLCIERSALGSIQQLRIRSGVPQKETQLGCLV